MALWYVASKVGQGRDRKGSHGNAYSAVKPRAGLWQGPLSFIDVDVPTHQVHKGWSTNPWDTCFLHCTLCSLHEEKGWVFSLADVASHLEFARPIELTANLNLNTQLNKISCRDEDVLLTWDPFEEWLQEKERLQVCPATRSNSPRLLKLQNITCLSYTGHCGGTGTEVVSASVADTSVKTLSVLIWNLCPLGAGYCCIPTEVADIP